MKPTLSVLFSVALNSLVAQCMTSNGRSGHGLIGYGITMYKPTCAYACRDSIASNPLNCTEPAEDMHAMAGMSHGSGETSPECYATDDAYLQTMAWCISTHCQDVLDWELERYWQMNVVGRASVQPNPKWTYGEALAQTTTPPTETLVSGNPLNKTSLVSMEDYMPNWNADVAFENAEDVHERYGLVLHLSGFIIPIGFSLLRFVPFPALLVTKFNAVFIDPPAFGSRHSTPVFFGLGIMPTRGQAFFILYIVVLNVILSAVGYTSVSPNAWFPEAGSETPSYITNRAGVLSFANMPLLILYAGRNNILLWVTNWSHSTFLLLHRWVAYICTLQACLHSAIYLQIYLKSGEHTTEAKLPYWIWGVIATLSMAILLPASILPLRQKMYELFLAWHVILSVFSVAGCYLHIYYRFVHQWGYEVWMFVAMAVWGFDRTMRVLRIVRNGVKTAQVTVIDGDYIRVNIEGVSGNGHAYLYFPTLTWRVWENHPFSVASTILPTPRASKLTHQDIDIEKSGVLSKVSASSESDSQTSTERQEARVGLTFLLRTKGGLTAQIRSRLSLPVLVESPYGSHPDLSEHPTLIAIAGGVGITAVIPFIRAHPGRTKLVWGARSHALVDEMQSVLSGVENEVFVGKRMSVSDVLEAELGGRKIHAVVVVSGPPGMADDVRMAVSSLGRRNAQGSIRLVEESFSW